MSGSLNLYIYHLTSKPLDIFSWFIKPITIQIGFYFMHSNKLGNNSLLGKVGRRIPADISKLCK